MKRFHFYCFSSVFTIFVVLVSSSSSSPSIDDPSWPDIMKIDSTSLHISRASFKMVNKPTIRSPSGTNSVGGGGRPVVVVVGAPFVSLNNNNHTGSCGGTDNNARNDKGCGDNCGPGTTAAVGGGVGEEPVGSDVVDDDDKMQWTAASLLVDCILSE